MTDDVAHRASSRSEQRAGGRPEHKDRGLTSRSASVLTIHYKRLPPWLNLDPQTHRSAMLVICSRVNLPSRITFIDHTATWCLAR